ncbi:MAG: hypothetical protein R2831_10910 [Chitinophagaceae bacterium]
METNNEINLLEELSKATETKPESITTEDAIQDIDSAQTDFAPESESDPTPTDSEASDNDEQSINAEDLTDLIIDGSEMLIETVLPWMHLKTFTHETRATLKEIALIYRKAKDNKSKIITFEEKHQEAMELYIEHEDYKELLPLSKSEKKNIKKPLSKLLQSVDFKASPSNALIAICALILLPRLLPLLKKNKKP